MTDNEKKRYAIVGTGGRIPMFVDPIVGLHKDHCELVGFCDVNPGRMAYHNRRLVEELGYHEVPEFAAADFDQMIERTRPDCIIVTTVDAFHHKYIIRAMELGCDAITEKPMTIDADKCCAILETIERTGRKLRVTFNYRWGPGPTMVRKVLSEGVVGEVIHVNMDYMLDTNHGADYFRRWHREKDKSGGLMVHKSTHHFDLVNWWIDAVPQTVFGMGRLAFYGRENAERRGIDVKYDRYTNEDSGDDPFAMNLLKDDTTRQLYYETEQYDGYVRDRNVFGDNITIEDTMSVLVRYRTGVTLNYSLNTYMPYEGWRVAINGTKGRLEYEEIHQTSAIPALTDQEADADILKTMRLMIYPLFAESYEVPIKRATGGHGGGDPKIQEQIFAPIPPDDPWGRSAGHAQGAASILIGAAANVSFQTGRPVQIDQLCPKLGDARQLSELA